MDNVHWGVHVQWILYTGGCGGYMIDTVHLEAVGGTCVWILYTGGLWGVHVCGYCTLGGCGLYMCVDTVHWGAWGVHDRYCTRGGVCGGT